LYETDKYSAFNLFLIEVTLRYVRIVVTNDNNSATVLTHFHINPHTSIRVAECLCLHFLSEL